MTDDLLKSKIEDRFELECETARWLFANLGQTTDILNNCIKQYRQSITEKNPEKEDFYKSILIDLFVFFATNNNTESIISEIKHFNKINDHTNI